MEGVCAVLWLRCCPRCNGDLCGSGDMYGQYVICAQCGYYLSEAEEAALRGTSSLRPGGRERSRSIPMSGRLQLREVS